MASTKAVVVACFDRRVQKPIRQFLEKENLPEGTWAPQNPPGASLNIETVLSNIDLAVNKLEVKQILLFDHQDCLAYKLINQDLDCEHLKCLWDAQQLLEAKYPNVKIRTFLMVFQNDEEWDIQET